MGLRLGLGLEPGPSLERKDGGITWRRGGRGVEVKERVMGRKGEKGGCRMGMEFELWMDVG